MRLSPSLLGSFVHFGCDKWLKEAEIEQVKKKIHPVPNSTVRAKTLHRGVAFEDTLNDLLKKIGVRSLDLQLASSGDKEAHWRLSEEAFSSPDPETMLYQPYLRPPPSCVDSHPELDLSGCFPDFVCFAANNDLIIIDAKASASAQLSHKAQVALYSIYLKGYGYQVCPTGGIWIPSPSQDVDVASPWCWESPLEPVWFDLAPIEQHVLGLLARIPRLLSVDQFGDISLPSCPHCQHFSECMEAAVSREDIATLRVGLSQKTSSELSSRFPSIPDLEDCLSSHSPRYFPPTVLARPGSGEERSASCFVEAYKAREAIPTGDMTSKMHREWDVCMAITIGAHPETTEASPLLVCIRVTKSSHCPYPGLLSGFWGRLSALWDSGLGSGGADCCMELKRSADSLLLLAGCSRDWMPAEGRANAGMVDLLCRALEMVHSACGDATNERFEGLRLSAVMWTASEKAFLLEMLRRASATRPEAKAVLLWLMNDPALIFCENHPCVTGCTYLEDERVFGKLLDSKSRKRRCYVVHAEAGMVRTVCLTGEISRAMAIPNISDGPLEESICFFLGVDGGSIGLVPIMDMWLDGDGAAPFSLLEKRVVCQEQAMLAVIEKVNHWCTSRGHVLRDLLPSLPPKCGHRLISHQTLPLASPLLSRLAFAVECGTKSSLDKAVSLRSMPVGRQCDEGYACTLQAVSGSDGKWEMKLLGGRAFYRGALPGGMAPFVLTAVKEEEPPYRLAGFQDLAYHNRFPGMPPSGVFTATISSRAADSCLLSLYPKSDLVCGQTYGLFARWMDWTTHVTLGTLFGVDRGVRDTPQDVFVLGCLKGVVPPSRPDVAPVELSSEPVYRELTVSQKQIVDWISTDSAAFFPVWGPPGSGKTRFAASLVVLSVLKPKKPGLRIVLTAFTTTAILNLVDGICKICHAHGISLDNLFLLQSSASTPCKSGVQTVTSTGERAALKRQLLAGSDSLILAGTVWQLNKLYKSVPAEKGLTDLLLIDEGSQFRLTDAAIVLRRLSCATGKCVVVGDPYQMPPLHLVKFELKSVMRSFLGHVMGMQKPMMLLENHRMCDELAAVHQQLYGKEYAGCSCCDRAPPAALPLSGPFSGTLPGVVAVLPPSEDAVSAEAAVVADLVLQCYSAADEAATSSVAEAISRIGQLLFVVTPHHVQRRAVGAALVSALAERFEGADPQEVESLVQKSIVVDTVERVQGQERKVVIACYAMPLDRVSEGELDFVYDINRLNVALSRAKHRFFLLCSSQLLASPPLEKGSRAACHRYLASLHGVSQVSL